MESPKSSDPPRGLEPTLTYREIHIEADCESLERQRKVGYVQGFTVYCDEREHVGGEGSAPSPLGYFTAAIGF